MPLVRGGPAGPSRGMVAVRRILRTMAVAVVCGSVSLLGACTGADTESAGSPSAGSPSAPGKTAEDLLGMLLTPDDLDGQWVIDEAGPPHVITDAERAESEWAGPAYSAICAGAPRDEAFVTSVATAADKLG